MNRYGVMARAHWARWLPQRYAAISDPDSFFSTLGPGSSSGRSTSWRTELAGDEPARGGLPGQGGPADRGAQPGRGDRPAAADPAATGAGSQRGPGGERPAAASTQRPAGDRPRPPDVGGDNAEQEERPRAANRRRGSGPGGQDDLAPSGAVARVRANLAALATLRAIQREDRPATPDEQAVLARWSGWGAVPEVFDDGRAGVTPGPARSCPRLLTPGGAGGRRPQHPQRALHRRRPRPGHLDRRCSSSASPAAGSWNRAAAAGTSSASRPAAPGSPGVELDPVTAAIAAALYPDADIASESFADTRAPDGSFDLAIGNVPFGKFALHRPAAQPGRAQHPQPLHHQVPAPGPARRPGRRGDLPLHHGRPQPRRPPRDRRPGRPGRRGPAAQRRAPAGRRAPRSSPTC